jgi:hypothetical protein
MPTVLAHDIKLGQTSHLFFRTMRTESIQYQIPTHWLPGLINHDYSGLESKESAQLSAFAQGEISGMRKQGRNLIGIDCSDDSYFMPFHDGVPYGCLPCDVTDCVMTFRID